ncbi:hypothetical protein GQ53DRAFT_849271 [Thozetella sp. PMI_491]|nr:hypothetical protein GQ53DRAFT_849271 [Thozetella sp. PMI_491]
MRPATAKALGLTQAHMAVLRGDRQKVWSLAKTRLLNEQNQMGATPLMLAALTANPLLVAALLTNGADFRIVDNDGRSARDYAGRNSTTRNLIEVYRDLRVPINLRFVTSTRAHQQIMRVLREPEALRALYRRGDHHFSKSYLFRDSNRSFVLMCCMGRILVGDNVGDSTFGFIAAQGGTRVEAAAISGWKTLRPSRAPLCLEKEEYTALVREAAYYLGFHLPGSFNDNGLKSASKAEKGRYNACHVEKKLAVYWARRALVHLFGTPDLSRLRDLKFAALPAHLRSAKIFLTRLPCFSCMQFLTTLRRVTGIDIAYEERPVLGRYSRLQNLRSCPNCGDNGTKNPMLDASDQYKGANPIYPEQREAEFDELGRELDCRFDVEPTLEYPRLRESLSPPSPAPWETTGEARRARNASTGPTQFTKAPSQWRHYPGDERHYETAKPFAKTIDRQEANSLGLPVSLFSSPSRHRRFSQTMTTPVVNHRTPARRLFQEDTECRLESPLSSGRDSDMADMTPEELPPSNVDGRSMYFSAEPAVPNFSEFMYTGTSARSGASRPPALAAPSAERRAPGRRVDKDEKIRNKSIFLQEFKASHRPRD